jgi:hypothetical protein
MERPRYIRKLDTKKIRKQEKLQLTFPGAHLPRSVYRRREFERVPDPMPQHLHVSKLAAFCGRKFVGLYVTWSDGVLEAPSPEGALRTSTFFAVGAPEAAVLVKLALSRSCVTRRRPKPVTLLQAAGRGSRFLRSRRGAISGPVVCLERRSSPEAELSHSLHRLHHNGRSAVGPRLSIDYGRPYLSWSL